MKYTTIIPTLLYSTMLSACGLMMDIPSDSYGSPRPSAPPAVYRPSYDDRAYGRQSNQYYGYQDSELRRRQEADFQALMQRLRSLHFDSERREELRRASRVLILTGEQMHKILDLYHFDSERFEALSILAPTIRTYRDILIVEQYFRFESERKRVRQILSRHLEQEKRRYEEGGRRPQYDDYYGEIRRRQEADFQALMQRLQSLRFHDERREELRRASRVLVLTGEQICRVLDLYRFDDEKFETLTILAPTVRTYRDALRVEDYFRFEDEKRRVRQILQSARR